MTIENTDNIIDPREVIARIEELEEQGPLDAEEINELLDLKALAEQLDSPEDGETLINEDHFVEYIQELIDDCYPEVKSLSSGKWPFTCITLDYEAAADEARSDYTEVTFRGTTFLTR